jgi:MFS family permease
MARARQLGKSYEAVEQDDDEELTQRQRDVKKWSGRLSALNRIIHSIFWCAAACAMIWYTNFFRVIWESPYVRRPFFYVGLSMLGFNMALIFYFAIVCETFMKLKRPWDEEYPDAIPAMCICAVGTYVCFIYAFWDVWGWITIVMVPIFFMGFISSGNLLPSGHLGSVLMFAIFFGAFFTAEYIPHEGLWHKKMGVDAKLY